MENPSKIRMIWGYPYFRKSLDGNIHPHIHQNHENHRFQQNGLHAAQREFARDGGAHHATAQHANLRVFFRAVRRWISVGISMIYDIC